MFSHHSPLTTQAPSPVAGLPMYRTSPTTTVLPPSLALVRRVNGPMVLLRGAHRESKRSAPRSRATAVLRRGRGTWLEMLQFCATAWRELEPLSRIITPPPRAVAELFPPIRRRAAPGAVPPDAAVMATPAALVVRRRRRRRRRWRRRRRRRRRRWWNHPGAPGAKFVLARTREQ